MKSLTLFLLLILPGGHVLAQPTFTRADSLRGMLTPLRTCYDIHYYHLDVKIDTTTKSLVGSNVIAFTATQDFDRMQVDLFENFKIEKIVLDDGRPLSFEREANAVFIQMPETLRKNARHHVTVFYSGMPQIARRPPWEGGFSWQRDELGNPWLAVTCQGTGASVWWPNKDHQSDEPDSMLLSVTVPKGLMNISNGRLRAQTDLPDNWTRFDWFISYPINNYNVTLNVGKYAHWRDYYIAGDTLTLDYYVMPYNLDKAKKQFQQVKPMMAAFEKYFGKFPFPRDGFKLVESWHLGMEHQTAVAYGNHYLQGYRGRASSPVGLKFDFIIIHETAHEWWGNSVTSEDIADMWIHESFGAYAEAVYVEELFGYEQALQYINGKKSNVQNDRPIIGVYGVHRRGSGDMYDKGQLVLNTLRHVIADDDLWWAIIKGLAEDFKHSIVTAEQIFAYINQKTGEDYGYFFEQYFKNTNIPELEITVTQHRDSVTAQYRWRAEAADFRMPVKVTTAKDKFVFIYPSNSWQTTRLEGVSPGEFRVAEDLFYIDVKLQRAYQYLR